MPFTSLTSGLLSRLSGITGPNHLFVDDETRERYARDETEDLRFLPDVVVRPGTTDEVAAILRLANESRFPVTPRGGGTGLSGGALPVHGGVVLLMDRFNRIREIDRENMQVVVEPGVTTQHLQEEVEALGMFYPPDPASRGTCHIGGNLAENAGGPRAVKYGVTRDYVLDLEAVLPTGDILHTGAAVLKNVAGYDLTRLLVGSEGTLAVITAARLRLLPLPKLRRMLLVAFADLEDAAAAVAAIFQHGVTPSALEFMERAAVSIAEERLGKKFPNGDAGAQLFIEVDGNYEEAIEGDIQAIAAALEQFRPLDILLAEERAKMDEVWNLRRGTGEAVKAISAYREEDTVVPRTALPRLIRGVKEICGRYGITSICYGHAGDGNVHVNLLKESLDDAAWKENAERAIREIFELTVSLGGTVSGEHGIGYSQKSYLPIALSQETLRLMRDIKGVFDPHGILNPGKVFP